MNDSPTQNSWSPITYNRTLSTEERGLMNIGLQAKDMDQRWDLYREDNNYIFARSWSKDAIYRLHIEGATITSAETTITGEGEEWNAFHTNFIHELINRLGAGELS